MSINGVVDVDSDPEENTITIFTKKEMLKQVLDEVKATLPNIEFNEAGLIKQAKDKVELDDKILDQNFTLVEKIKSHSDVVYVWDNIK
jgi:transcriptional/translational regulatory protein YebC/TACO1